MFVFVYTKMDLIIEKLLKDKESVMDSSAGKSKSGFVENRSIDFIPENERHGSIFAQFTLWFGANLQITAIVTGALAVVLGVMYFGQSLASLLDNALVLPSWLYTQLKVQNSASHK